MSALLTLPPTKTRPRTVPSFRLSDHVGTERTLSDVSGASGVLLALFGDMWLPESVQRILGLQRYGSKLAALHCPIAAIVTNRISTLANFMASSPLTVSFPLLADPEGDVHRAYGAADAPLLLLIDRDRVSRECWTLARTQLLPPMDGVLSAAHHLSRE